MIRYGSRYGPAMYGSGNRKEYFAQSTRPDEDGWYPLAQMEVSLPREVPVPDASLLDDYDDERSTHYDLTRSLQDTHAPDNIDAIVDEQTHTPQMFIHQPGVIRRMTADSSMRHSAGSILGMLYDDAQKNKQTFMPDASLSRHSSKLVQRAINAGILRPNPNNPEGVQSNSIDFMTHRVPDFELFERRGKDRDPDDVKKSRDALVNRMSRRPENLSTQFDALDEPGYEQLKLEGL